MDQDNGYPKSLLIAMKLRQILSGCQHQTLLGYFRSKDGKTIRNLNDTNNESFLINFQYNYYQLWYINVLDGLVRLS